MVVNWQSEPEQSGSVTLCLVPLTSVTTPSVPLMSTDLTLPAAAWFMSCENDQDVVLEPPWNDCQVNQITRPRTTTSAK